MVLKLMNISLVLRMGKGTTDAMLLLRILIEQSARKCQDQELWLMFIAYAKAFDTVTHRALWDTLIGFGVPKHLDWLIRQLYQKAIGVVSVYGDVTESFTFERGVRQGCLLSPMLFNALGETIMRSVASDSSETVGCEIADDTTLLANKAKKSRAAGVIGREAD